MDNEYQAEMRRIRRQMEADVKTLINRARDSGHFPDEPGLTDGLGDPINPGLARAEREAEKAWTALGEARRYLFVESLHEPNVSF